MIPYGRQSIDEEDIQAVAEVLRSDFLTQGPAVPRFEETIASYCGVSHVVAVNSATSALHIACSALGVGAGDVVWTSPNTFVASANCARYCGATVDFIDIDPITYNISVQALAEKLERAAAAGSLPKVVIPVHFAGTPCDMARISELAGQYRFHVIEDASHAIGARYADGVVGDCRFSDITVFSFHPVKVVTTAEGGAATTSSGELARRMRLLRSHGITRAPGELQLPTEGPWYYEQNCLGFNYRMTDVHAALGTSQMRRLDEWIERRHVIAERYDETLRCLPLILPQRPQSGRSALHLYVVQIDTSRTTVDRRTIFDHMRRQGVGVNVHYIPVHTQPYYRSMGFQPGLFPEAERYYARALSLPMFAALGDEDIGYIVSTMERAFGECAFGE